MEFAVEHPFFVLGRGWSSCQPSITAKRYQVDCQLLRIGDVCLSLSLVPILTNYPGPNIVYHHATAKE